MSTLLRSPLAPDPHMNWGRSIAWAFLTHVALVLALSWGITWKHDLVATSFEVEVVSDVIQESAARAPEPELAPPPPAPQVKAPPPTPASTAKPDIVDQKAKEKKRLEDEAAKKKAEAEKRKQDEKAKAEQARKDKLSKAEAERKKKADAQEKREQALRVQAAKDQAARLSQLTKTLPSATVRDGSGTAAQSSGPSAGYGGLVVAKVRPNIIYTDSTAGNPSAVVEVRAASNGLITGKRLIKPSGVPAWDQAVLRAIDRTGSLPKDKDGSVPSSLEIVFERNN